MPFAPDGPLHARPYTDEKGRVWHFDATTLNHEGRACFRHVDEEGNRIEVFGPNLTSEDEFEAWAERLENPEQHQEPKPKPQDDERAVLKEDEPAPADTVTRKRRR